MSDELKFDISRPVKRKAVYSDDPILADIWARLDGLEEALETLINAMPSDVITKIEDDMDAQEDSHVNDPPDEDELDVSPAESE